MRAALALALVALLATACGSPGPTPAPATSAAAEAIKAFERSDWVLAARLLREALVQDAGNLTLHYYLAISATHLDLRDEAVREFRWVLQHAAADSAEAQTARQWLTDAGVLSTASATTPTASTPGGEATRRDPTVGDSGVQGQVSWSDDEGPLKISRMQLFLKGIPKTPTRDFYYVKRTDEGGRFEFKAIPPGTYKLTNRITGKPQWRLLVKLEPGQALTLDLTPQNSTKIRDDFPQDE